MQELASQEMISLQKLLNTVKNWAARLQKSPKSSAAKTRLSTRLSRREFWQSTRALSQMLRKSRSGSFWRRTFLLLVESLVSGQWGIWGYPVTPSLDIKQTTQPGPQIHRATHGPSLLWLFHVRSFGEGGVSSHFCLAELSSAYPWFCVVCCRMVVLFLFTGEGRKILLIAKRNLEVNVCSHPPDLLHSNIVLCPKMVLSPLKSCAVFSPQAQQ